MTKLHSFYSPIEGKDMLMRTKIQNDDLYHCILYAHSSDYRARTPEERLKFVETLKNVINKSLIESAWNDFTTDAYGKTEITSNCAKNITDLYKYIIDKNPKNTTEFTKNFKDDYESISLLLDFIKKKYLDDFFENVFNKYSNNSLTDFIKKLDDEINNFFKEKIHPIFKKLLKKTSKSDEKKLNKKEKKLHKLLNFVISEIFIYSINETRKDFNNKQKNYKEKILITLLQKKLNKRIYIIDFSTRIPYIVSKKDDIELYKDCIMLLKIENNKYELLGKTISPSSCKYVLKQDDRLIDRIHCFLYDKDRLEEDYPSLVPYLEGIKEKEDSDSVVDFFDDNKNKVYKNSNKSSEKSSSVSSVSSSDEKNNYYDD